MCLLTGMLKDVVTSSEQPARQSNGCPAAAKDPSAEAVASAGHAGATAPAHSPWASTMPQTWQSHMSMEDTMMRRIAECKVLSQEKRTCHQRWSHDRASHDNNMLLMALILACTPAAKYAESETVVFQAPRPINLQMFGHD